MSIQLHDTFNFRLSFPAGTPWPATCTHSQIAFLLKLAHPGPTRWIDLLALACERGELDHTTTTERIPAPGIHVLNTGHPHFIRKPRPTVEIALHNIAAAPLAHWLEGQDQPPGELLEAWFKSQGVGVAVEQPAPAVESAEAREDRRLKMCVDAGLPMGRAAIHRLPDGVGDIADREGVSRQTFSADVKKALRRKHPETKPNLRAV